MIIDIPLTVFIKIIMEQFPKTKLIADMSAGPKKKDKTSLLVMKAMNRSENN